MARRRTNFDPESPRETQEFLDFFNRTDRRTEDERRGLEPSVEIQKAFVDTAIDFLSPNSVSSLDDINDLVGYLYDLESIPDLDEGPRYRLYASLCRSMLTTEDPLLLGARRLSEGLIVGISLRLELPRGENLARAILDGDLAVFVEASADGRPYYVYQKNGSTYFGLFDFLGPGTIPDPI